jgi:hypothetical protein
LARVDRIDEGQPDVDVSGCPAGLEGPCETLVRELSECREHSRNVRRSLELQKIQLVQERDDLYRQRQLLIRECAEIRDQLADLQARRTLWGLLRPSSPGNSIRSWFRANTPAS